MQPCLDTTHSLSILALAKMGWPATDVANASPIHGTHMPYSLCMCDQASIGELYLNLLQFPRPCHKAIAASVEQKAKHYQVAWM